MPQLSLLATVLALLPQAFSAPQVIANIESAENGASTKAFGTTYFTADGYYHTDCTGNKYWSYEVSAGSLSPYLGEKEEIGSVWIHNYGDCKDGHVKVEQLDRTGNHLSTQSTSRGQCLHLSNDGWGAYTVHMWCELV